MTDYNDGKWHGWNGGECPVHPKSVVQLVRGDTITADVVTWRAEECQDICWTHRGATHSIIAFRVVKEYREPREVWVNEYNNEYGLAFYSEKDALDVVGDHATRKAVRFREVLE